MLYYIFGIIYSFVWRFPKKNIMYYLTYLYILLKGQINQNLRPTSLLELRLWFWGGVRFWFLCGSYNFILFLCVFEVEVCEQIIIQIVDFITLITKIKGYGIWSETNVLEKYFPYWILVGNLFRIDWEYYKNSSWFLS